MRNNGQRETNAVFIQKLIKNGKQLFSKYEDIFYSINGYAH